MDNWNTEYIISLEISKRKEQYDNECLDKKKRCNEKTWAPEDLFSDYEHWKDKEMKISSINENLESQETEQWQMNI